MVNTSKKKLRADVRKRIDAELLNFFVSRNSSRDMSGALQELLTESERLMLAKRFAAFALAARGMSSRRIADLLAMSHTTVSQLSQMLENNDAPALAKHLGHTRMHKESFQEQWLSGYYTEDEMLNILGTLLRGGMPAYGNTHHTKRPVNRPAS